MNMIGEMIGPKSKNAGIVYGVYSFFDKITNGLIIFFIMVIYSNYFISKILIEFIIIQR